MSVKRSPGQFELLIESNSARQLSIVESEKFAPCSGVSTLSRINLDKQGGSLATLGTKKAIDITLSGESIAVVETGSWCWPAHLQNGVRTARVSHPTEGRERRVIVDFRSRAEKHFANLFVDSIGQAIMAIFLMGKENGKAFAKGWVYDPHRQPGADGFRLNNQTADIVLTTSQPGWETHLGPVFSYFSMKGEEHFTFFDAKVTAKGSAIEPVVVEYNSTPEGLFDRCRFGYVEDNLPMPRGETFKRVSGNPNPFTFRLSGYSASLVLRDIVRHYLDKSVAELSRVLDWGCGCGRVSRHFRDDAGRTHWCGADIDEIGVQWAQENLPFGHFHHIKPLEKTPYPDNHFELIFGISVFTHLREADHLFWLQELARILAPAGIVAVSIAGKTLRARLFTTDINELTNDLIAGYTDHGRSDAIDGSTSDIEYYRSTFISEDYVRTVWSRYFDVLDIHPGLIGCRQDLVVMGKKPAHQDCD